MRMSSDKRAIDKIYKRRDRYEIPDWQRQAVWGRGRKQELIDSILRGWKLPKFYFLKTSSDEELYEVVDGQQRLTSIFEFFDNDLPLSAGSAAEFGGRSYKDLPSRVSDAFDDYDIQFDLLEEAEEEDVKLFFQRLQNGLPLTSSEKLNSIDSKLRDFVKELTKHDFFASVPVTDRRYGYFDILCKVAVLEIDGIDAGLRYDELKSVLESSKNFSPKSKTAIRIKASLEILDGLTTEQKGRFRNRTFVQSALTLTCRLVDSIRGKPRATASLGSFFLQFLEELNRQIELGNRATDKDYVEFQRTINANIRKGARIRQVILTRKLLSAFPQIADSLDAVAIAEVASASSLRSLAVTISETVASLNAEHAAKKGSDLFKPTNRTVQAQQNLGIPVKDLAGYMTLIENLYFLFHEGPSDRLQGQSLPAFDDLNDLRTDLQHDLDHGKASKAKAKRRKVGAAFQKYSGVPTPNSLDPEKLVIVQGNLLSAVISDLNAIKI
ncbi:MAG: DUF262 domain-containing protein [Acidobacteriia bacterium]|nr:DUF262 domain-containing protein [Terriglobia bacterium]